MDVNPYKAPQVAEVAAEAVISDPERIRREHLRHEVSLKGAGSLMVLGGLFVGFGIFAVFSLPSPDPPARSGISSDMLVPLGVMALLMAAQITAGVGLRMLAPWSWIPAIVVSGLSLLSIPVGTLIGGYFLYLLLSAKGRRILSKDYREIRRLTPHVKYRTPWWIWAILIAVVLGILGMFVWFGIAGSA